MKRIFLTVFAVCSVLMANPMQWRGVMIDVSRHFFPMEELYRQIDIMGNYGLNVLHLHLTDAAGWRMEIKQYPRLTEIGAWRTRALWKEWWNMRAYSDSISGYGGYYTQEQLRQLVLYAQSRGVTIVPEIEFPGHSEEVCAAYPQVAFNHAEMDMSNPETFRFMYNILKEVADVFPSEYIHCGGDETATQRDQYPPAIRRMNEMVRSMGRRMIVWDEALTDNPTDSTIVIMVWRDAGYARKAMDMGHDVIMCPSSHCYLDSYQDSPATQPEAMGGYRPIERVLGVRDLIPEGHSRGRLLGVQANLFTEYVPSCELLQYQLWPRALAIAEVGFHRKRPVRQFRKWTMHVADSLRAAGVNAFDLRNELGQRPQASKPVMHLARGCKVVFGENCRYSDAYAASGDNALTDGIQGTWNNNDGRWQGFCCNLDITIDLGRERAVSEVSLPFMQITGPGIFLPQQVWCNGILMQHDAAPDRPYSIRTYTLKQKTRTRYIRIKAQRIPHAGWLFVDEITVK